MDLGYGGVILPVVNVYKYLGICFSTKLSFSLACRDLVSRAKNALLYQYIQQKLNILGNNSLELYLKLFDVQIQPILLYGSEIWGFDLVASQHCEKLHLYALKKYLGVENRTPNDLVYGETDRYPIVLNCILRGIRYWLKLIKMDQSRLPFKSYRMLFELDSRGKTNWVSQVRCKLFQFGFGYVWVNQGVQNEKQFLSVFRQRLIDCQWQLWDIHVQTSDRFSLFRTFSSSHERKTYLQLNIDRHLRFLLTRFRLGISDIAVHQYRYKRHDSADLLCPLCKIAEENEMHFVFICPALKHLREKFLPAKFCRFPNLFKLTLLLSSTNGKVIHNFGVFLYRSFKLRSIVQPQ